MKKIKTQNKQEEIQDISSSYGVDIEEQLTSMLSEELAKSIDREILTSLGIELDRWKRRKTSIGKIFSS